MTMHTHTPTPWIYGYHDGSGKYGDGGEGGGINTPHKDMAKISPVVRGGLDYGIPCGVVGSTPDEAHANGEFIVRACNCHDELVAALESLIHLAGPDGDFANNAVAVYDQAKAALAKAKGGAA